MSLHFAIVTNQGPHNIPAKHSFFSHTYDYFQGSSIVIGGFPIGSRRNESIIDITDGDNLHSPILELDASGIP